MNFKHSDVQNVAVPNLPQLKRSGDYSQVLQQTK